MLAIFGGNVIPSRRSQRVQRERLLAGMARCRRGAWDSCVRPSAERHLCPLWTRPLLRALELWPTFGYALFFSSAFKFATLFWDIRIALSDLGFSVQLAAHTGIEPVHQP